MWNAVRELMTSLTPSGRLWLAIAIIAALVATLIVLVYAGQDPGPLFRLLTGS